MIVPRCNDDTLRSGEKTTRVVSVYAGWEGGGGGRTGGWGARGNGNGPAAKLNNWIMRKGISR